MTGTHPTRRRWLTLGAAGVTVLVVVGVAVIGFSWVFRSQPGPKSVSSALDRLRASSTTAGSASDVLVRPAAGVYRARGHGQAKLSTPPVSQIDGAIMPITVQYLDHGCWRWRIDYNSSRWSEQDVCPKGSRLLLTRQRNYQRWNFGLSAVSNRAEYRCSRPAPIVVAKPQAGQRFSHDCSGTNSAVEGPSVSKGQARTVGATTVTIGGRHVAAIKQTRDQTMSGSQSGHIHEDWWFDRTTGLPLRCDRRYRLDTDSPLGRITYSEDGSWQLASLRAVT